MAAGEIVGASGGRGSRAQVGVVAALWRYPVKSMAGEALAEASLRWTGIEGDRQYAYLRASDRSRFPWLTGRDMAGLVRYRPRYLDPGDPRRSPVRAVTAAGVEHELGDLEGPLSAQLGEPVRLVQIGRGCFDSMPVSVVSEATGRAVGAAVGREVDLKRFRPNIVIAADVPEWDWVGGALVFGDGPARLRLNARIERCQMITIDPESAAKDPSLLRCVAQDFDNRIGVYGAIEAIGAIAVGDPVWLDPA
jgi:uncharacterized protein